MDTAPDILAGFIDRASAAKGLKVSERTIARYENQPDGLPSLTIGGKKFYRIEAVREWIARRERKPNPRRQRAA